MNFIKNVDITGLIFQENIITEKIILGDYIRNNLNSADYRTEVFTNSVVNTYKIKEFFGRVIGSISRKYYNEICKQSDAQNIYTYELRHESKAAKIFLPEFRKNSLQELTMNKRIALKKFIVFLVFAKGVSFQLINTVWQAN